MLPVANEGRVTSSSLFKKAEGVVLPLLIELLKNRIDDSLHAGHVYEQDHAECAAELPRSNARWHWRRVASATGSAGFISDGRLLQPSFQ